MPRVIVVIGENDGVGIPVGVDDGGVWGELQLKGGASMTIQLWGRELGRDRACHTRSTCTV